jgi:hypothetical protein
MIRAGVLFLLAGTAQAEPLASLHSDNGTVAPPYRVDQAVEIAADGMVRLRVCKGYATDPSACSSLAGQARPEALAAIAEAARAAGIVVRPIAEDPMPPVGGGTVSGAVWIDGKAYPVPPFPVEADRTRAAAVLAAISAAVPADLTPVTGE